MIQIDLNEDYDLACRFSFDQFPLENSLLVTCRKDLITHFVLDSYSCFHFYDARYFDIINDYITTNYPYETKVIKCYKCYRKSIKHIGKSFPASLK